MNKDHLIECIYMLSIRVSGLGIGAEIYALTLSELWGLYIFLKRIAGE